MAQQTDPFTESLYTNPPIPTTPGKLLDLYNKIAWGGSFEFFVNFTPYVVTGGFDQQYNIQKQLLNIKMILDPSKSDELYKKWCKTPVGIVLSPKIGSKYQDFVKCIICMFICVLISNHYCLLVRDDVKPEDIIKLFYSGDNYKYIGYYLVNGTGGLIYEIKAYDLNENAFNTFFNNLEMFQYACRYIFALPIISTVRWDFWDKLSGYYEFDRQELTKKLHQNIMAFLYVEFGSFFKSIIRIKYQMDQMGTNIVTKTINYLGAAPKRQQMKSLFMTFIANSKKGKTTVTEFGLTDPDKKILEENELTNLSRTIISATQQTVRNLLSTACHVGRFGTKTGLQIASTVGLLGLEAATLGTGSKLMKTPAAGKMVESIGNVLDTAQQSSINLCESLGNKDSFNGAGRTKKKHSNKVKRRSQKVKRRSQKMKHPRRSRTLTLSAKKTPLI